MNKWLIFSGVFSFIADSNKRALKNEIRNLSDYRDKESVVLVVHPKQVETRKVIKYKPSVKKLGKNYIEMAQISVIESIVIRTSPSLKQHTVSPGVLKFAKLMMRSRIAGLRRIGYDIIDD